LDAKSNRLIRLLAQNGLESEVAAFLIDREARSLSPRTLEYYREQLGSWLRWMAARDITEIGHLTAASLREWLLHLAQAHRPAGVDASYRAMRAFLHWCWEENDLPGCSPLAKVRPPKVPDDLLEPLDMAVLKALLATCDRDSFAGCRDKAMLLGLLDTGCRASEFVALDIGDVDLNTGSVLVRLGKGGKTRSTFLGSTCKRELVRYLRYHPSPEPNSPLWIANTGARLTYEGLRMVLRRRSARASVAEPTLHSFRRAFALLSLRNGADIYSLQRLMGHTDLAMLRRYLKQTDEDLEEAHQRAGPVDNAL
jgi:integrase/recombinase XerC